MRFKKLKRILIDVKTLWEDRYHNNVFQVLLRTISRQRPNGQYVDPASYFVFSRGNSVMAMILLEDTQELVVLRQYRAGADQYIFDFPAGMREGDEDPLEAVKREVMEETGYEAKSIEHIFHLALSPGAYTEEADIYFIISDSTLKTGKGGGLSEESEELEVFHLPLDEVFKMIRPGGDGVQQIVDAKTIIAIQWLENDYLKMFE